MNPVRLTAAARPRFRILHFTAQCTGTRTMTLRTTALALLAALAVLTTANPAAASEAGARPALLAGYWAEFLDHWTQVFQQQKHCLDIAQLLRRFGDLLCGPRRSRKCRQDFGL